MSEYSMKRKKQRYSPIFCVKPADVPASQIYVRMRFVIQWGIFILLTIFAHTVAADENQVSGVRAGFSQKFSSPAVIRLVAPEVVKEETARALKTFSPQNTPTQRGRKISTPHFTLYTDMTAEDGARIATELEALWVEASLVAEMWRRPADAKIIPADHREGNRGASGGVSSFRENVFPENQKIPVYFTPPLMGGNQKSQNSCRFSADSGVARLDISPSLLATPVAHGPALRQAVFQSVLMAGGEHHYFPQWIQTGLASIFSGQPLPASVDTWQTLSAPGGGVSMVDALRESRLDMDAFSFTAHLWTRYYLTADDGGNAPDFLKLLNTIYAAQSPIFETVRQKALAGEMLVSVELQNRSRAEVADSVRGFMNGVSAKDREGMFSQKEWLKDPHVGTVEVVWPRNVDILGNVPDAAPQEVPLPEAFKSIYGEMGVILKLAAKARAEVARQEMSPDTRAQMQPRVQADGGADEPFSPAIFRYAEGASPGGMRIHDNDKMAAGKGKTSKIPENDRRRLERVYETIISGKDAISCTLDADGTLLFPSRDEKRLKELFHPQDRAYLLQYYDGDLVLSVTMKSGDVFHVVLQEAEQKGGHATVEILGYQPPAPAKNAEKSQASGKSSE